MNIFNSLRQSDVYIHQCIIPTLLQIMAPSHYLIQYCHNVNQSLSLYFSEILFKIHKFSFKEMHLKISSAKVATILPSLNVLKGSSKITIFPTNNNHTINRHAWNLPNSVFNLIKHHTLAVTHPWLQFNSHVSKCPENVHIVLHHIATAISIINYQLLRREGNDAYLHFWGIPMSYISILHPEPQ